ncbi:hypothetical protein H6G41_30480 [Tolypothrix sp. FACHB-123]|uniref:hypothetical protein n=1 Tax=Tolypothrix sp. FACHB-123 TaxID=2692868 RepID=UPI0016899CDF|nr:hypothetical protein [Tolypothrix sp. FACHB-123]MBD2358875.1 hypothetical protein [Tolypothrix sp. FACHB-123]
MVSKITLQIFEKAVSRFSDVEAECLKDWQAPCNCPNPGQTNSCSKCPYFKDLVLQIQNELHQSPTEVFPVILPPEIQPPYSDEVKQQCLEMYSAGYPIEKIKQLTGVTNRKIIRKWINTQDFLKEPVPNKLELRQYCVNLYAEGMKPKQIEDLTGVSAAKISHWVEAAGISRPRKIYSDTQKQNSLALYQEGYRIKEIENITGVHGELVRTWAKRAKIHRARLYKVGGIPVHSLEVRESCRKLLEQGKNPPQIEELLGINTKTIRKWAKQWGIH